VGNGDLGVNITAGKLGAVINTETKKFAAVASGTAALQGVDGLTVTGSGSVRINQLDAAIDETICTPGGPVEVKFTSDADVLQVRGRSTCNSRILSPLPAIFCLKSLKVVISPRSLSLPAASTRSLVSTTTRPANSV
jgi:hypothetical protein